MKKFSVILASLAVGAASMASLPETASAKGCIKGAVVGAVAGHMVGHGKMGAAAGCAVGHHEANKAPKDKGGQPGQNNQQ